MCDEVTIEIRNTLVKIEQRLIATESPWFTITESCAYLKCGSSHVHHLMKVGKLKYTRLSDGKSRGRVLIHRKWLLAAALGYGRKLDLNQRIELQNLEEDLGVGNH